MYFNFFIVVYKKINAEKFHPANVMNGLSVEEMKM